MKFLRNILENLLEESNNCNLSPLYFERNKQVIIGNMKTPTRKIATRMIPTGQIPPGKLPSKKIPTEDNSHPDSSHPENSLRITPTRKITTQDNPHLDNSHPENFHPGKFQNLTTFRQFHNIFF